MKRNERQGRALTTDHQTSVAPWMVCSCRWAFPALLVQKNEYFRPTCSINGKSGQLAGRWW